VFNGVGASSIGNARLVQTSTATIKSHLDVTTTNQIEWDSRISDAGFDATVGGYSTMLNKTAVGKVNNRLGVPTAALLTCYG